MSSKNVSLLLCLGVAVGISACSVGSTLLPLKSGVTGSKGQAKTTSKNSPSRGFSRLSEDPRIQYETGAMPMALEVKRLLDAKASVITKRQYAPFTKPITVFVLNSEKSAKRHCSSWLAKGCVVNQKLFIAKRAANSLPQLILHELSHLHTEQKLGMLRYHSEVPAWFQEGLAVFVSNGAGAEKVSFEKAIKGLRSEKSITPSANRWLLFPKKAAQFGIKNSMFYAQSGIFVKYLHQQDPSKFKQLVLNISRRGGFSQSIKASYQQPLSKLWADFKEEVTNKDIAWLKRYSFK